MNKGEKNLNVLFYYLQRISVQHHEWNDNDCLRKDKFTCKNHISGILQIP